MYKEEDGNEHEFYADRCRIEGTGIRITLVVPA